MTMFLNISLEGGFLADQLEAIRKHFVVVCNNFSEVNILNLEHLWPNMFPRNILVLLLKYLILIQDFYIYIIAFSSDIWFQIKPIQQNIICLLGNIQVIWQLLYLLCHHSQRCCLISGELHLKSSAGNGISIGRKKNPHHTFPGQLNSHS